MKFGSTAILWRGSQGRIQEGPGCGRDVLVRYLTAKGNKVYCELLQDDPDATCGYCMYKGDQGWWSRGALCEVEPLDGDLAWRVAYQYGKKLIGRQVLTEQMGDWPGGWAEVIEIAPDSNAPQIVFNVRHPKHGEIGIFDHEHVFYQEKVTG